jgi:hypothetical protein
MKIYFELINAIDKKRKDLGMTVDQLCDQSKVCKQSWYDTKKKKSILSSDRLIRLLITLNIKNLEL